MFEVMTIAYLYMWFMTITTYDPHYAPFTPAFDDNPKEIAIELVHDGYVPPPTDTMPSHGWGNWSDEELHSKF